MIVLEINYEIDDKSQVSFSCDVLGQSKDDNGPVDKDMFEKTILPKAMELIKMRYSESSLIENPELIVDIMNVIVAEAKKNQYFVKRIGQNERHIGTYQLEFYKSL